MLPAVRYLNSAAFGFANEIHSVRHAWPFGRTRSPPLDSARSLPWAPGQGKTSELVLSALVRARFCELLSPKVAHGDSDLFLMGLLSLMDVILEIPMSQVLDNVPIDQETKSVLLRRSQPFCGPSINSCWPRNQVSGEMAVNWLRPTSVD